ncbi:MAG: cytochrome c family protein, partial [Acidobacteria bacterium]|nr:cytochrome c family protein [Acidobacteriota bacterium]
MGGSQAQELPFMEYSRVDPAQIVTAEACGECHASAFEVWKDTPHATTFKTMHRKKRAETIAKKLGFGLIKRDSFCFSCHYTPVVKSGTIRVVSGVSCESCHGAGAQWIEVHNDYGPGQTHETESAEHRLGRIERSRQLGMRRPSDLYEVAANCFGCHSVPNERLVNDGGHSSGSAGFELVEWSQGEIRHNFLDSFKQGQVGPNAQRSSERRRVMYVAGRALDLEYSLRGAAVASGGGLYAKAMSRRVRSALAEVKAIQASVDIPEMGRMLAAVKQVRVGPGNEPALLAAADAVGRETRSFLGRADRAVGTRLAALDPLLAGTTLAIDPESVASAGPSGSAATEVAATSADDQPAGVPGATTTPTRATTPTVDPAAGRERATGTSPGVIGQIKRRIRPASSHRTLGSNACSGCH